MDRLAEGKVTIYDLLDGQTGPQGPALVLTPSGQTFTHIDNVAVPASQSLTFTASLYNLTGTVVFSTVPDVTLTGTGNSRTLSVANFGVNKQVVVTATVGTISDSIVVIRANESTAEAGATVGATWDTVTGIPYSTIYNNDDSVALGFNPTFSDWTGAFPAGWYDYNSSSSRISKETTIKRVGDFAVRFTTPAATNCGMVKIVDFKNASNEFSPLPSGTFISGTVDIYIVNWVGPGKPGLLVRPRYNTTGSYRETKVVPAAVTTGVWHRVPFTARLNAGESMYGLQIYIMASYSSLGQCEGTVIFDNIRFAFFDSSVDNTTIQIAANGALTGAGGGQVSITGLGFSGDLNATVGAPAGTLVGGTPAEQLEINAANALIAVTAMEADGTFSIAEKRIWKTEWEGMSANYTSVRASAVALAVSVAALDTAKTNLYSFLNTAQVWAVTLTNTPLISSTLRTYTAAFYTQMAACVTATAAKSAANAQSGAKTYTDGIDVAAKVNAGGTQISYSKIYTPSLSTLSANIGTCTAGVLRSADTYRGVNLNATGETVFLYAYAAGWVPKFYVTANGNAYFAGTLAAEIVKADAVYSVARLNGNRLNVVATGSVSIAVGGSATITHNLGRVAVVAAGTTNAITYLSAFTENSFTIAVTTIFATTGTRTVVYAYI
jgi:hypothetical protein